MSMHKILFLPAVIGVAGCVRESQMMCGVGGGWITQYYLLLLLLQRVN